MASSGSCDPEHPGAIYRKRLVPTPPCYNCFVRWRQAGAWPICFSSYLYRACNRVERFFNRIKQCRRVATCYAKLAALAFVQLASIRLWLAAR
jgi:transposase